MAPLFADVANGDFHLLPGSPGIDAGNNTALPAGTTTDLGGAPRLADDPAPAHTGVGTPPTVAPAPFADQPPPLPSACPVAVIANDKVIVCVDGVLHLLALDNGNSLWNYEVSDRISSPAIVNDMIIVGSEDGTVIAFGNKA